MEKVEALDLLEDSWFFENLFDRRTRMLRCYSDRYTSPHISQRVMANGSRSNGLVRAPSLPPGIGREDKVHAKKINDGNTKLDRQLSLQTSYKAMNLQRCSKSPRNQEVEAISNTSEMRFRRLNSKRMLQKSQSDLAFLELQGFKDLGFTFDNKDLSPDVINILPGLQGKQINDLEQDEVREPYLSEAWLVPPPIPACVSKNSAEDMKAQIKFWARAVATNVRQEC